MKNNPILVTGAHASGTTFTGKMIALSPEVAYFHEPFNIVHRPGIWAPEFRYWFTYISKENEKLYKYDIKNFLNLENHFLIEIPRCKNFRDYLRLIKYSIIKKYDKITNKRILVKDPIAIMSTEWLANTFNMDVIILIRHPLAFVGSLKNNNWKHPFDHFIKQPLLMEHYLSKFKYQIEFFAEEEQPIVEQAILLWNIIYSIVFQYYEKYKDKWLFIEHEDLSLDPINTFNMIYKKLGIKFNSRIREKIYEYTHTNKSKDNFKRDSKNNIFSWKKRLTDDEIKNVKEKTKDISSFFYSDEGWL